MPFTASWYHLDGRFLGYVAHMVPDMASAQELQFQVFERDDARRLVDSFANWLVSEERGNSYGTVANYLNSLLSCLAYATAEVCDSVDESLQDAIFNLRSQSEAAAREARLYRKRHPMWITW